MKLCAILTVDDFIWLFNYSFLPALTLARSFILLRTIAENQNKSYAIILMSFLSSWSHIPWSAIMISEKIVILVKFCFCFPSWLLVILNTITLFVQINIGIATPHFRELFCNYTSLVLCLHNQIFVPIFWK